MGASLGITGSLGVTKYDRSLYSAFRREVNKGYAVEYSGNHQDSLAGGSNETIYHWYASSDAQGTEILDRNNVIFANQCWQMIRTTDTGGVKLLYNGEAVNNQCLNTRDNHVGYSSATQLNLTNNYYYADNYYYDGSMNIFGLTGSGLNASWNDTTASSIIGKYTCLSGSSDGTCPILYYVESYASSTVANVLPLDANSNYSQYGAIPYNNRTDSLAYAGYMYNTAYPSLQGFGDVEVIMNEAQISTDYWYFSGAGYGENPDTGENEWSYYQSFQISGPEEYSNLIGKYTFQSNDPTYQQPTIQYIVSISGDTYSYINLTETTIRDRYYFGDSYIDNQDGTYRIVSAMTVDASNWDANYGRLSGKYICKNAQACTDVMFVTAANHTQFSYANINNVFTYATGFTYDGTNYTLDGDTVSFWNISDSTNQASLSNHHYTCWNDTGTCSEISYIHYVNGAVPYYIRLSNGESIDDARVTMLAGSGVNQTSSTIKNGIDAWYRKYISGYDNYLEDAIYCYDRSISNLNGWNPNGGLATEPLQFRNSSINSDLSCPNIKDRYAVGNSEAQLTYKVGMITTSELNLYNNAYARKTGLFYWASTPYTYSGGMNGYRVDYDGFMQGIHISSSDGLRPVVTLIPGILYNAGNGSQEKPYVIDYEL